MHPPDCPTWEYGNDPRRHLLSGRVKSILIRLASGSLDTKTVAPETRPQHEELFSGLTPLGCEYFAGHYRGENFRCLQFNQVGIQTDPRVGAVHSAVGYRMSGLGQQILSGLSALDCNILLSAKDKAQYVVALACCAFVEFLTIHPFVNGNGHAARLVLWCILGRYGFWPRRFPVEPRPADPPYTQLIFQYRNGDREPLERLVLQSLTN